MSCKILRLLFVLLFLILPPALWAQTSGSIRGEVKDSEGNVLPGAAVTISSEALIGKTRSTTTNELGVFRFPSLPVGNYKVEVKLEGFESVFADEVKVSLGGTANVPLTMKMSAMA